MTIRQFCGANAGGLSQVTVSGCLSGAGTLISPVTISLNPTGGIHCTPSGLAINGSITASSSIITSGCLSGSGTVESPAVVVLNPTGGIQCTVAGLALQHTYLTSVVPTGCLSGSGTLASPIAIRLSPTGGLNCVADGLALQTTYLTSIVSSGCLTGSGTTASPVVVLLNPTGGLHCTPSGLAINATIASSVVTSGCVTGSGTVASPVTLLINPTGKIHCTPAGIALQETYLTQVITSGNCLGGIGTAGSPILLNLNATGGLNCTSTGLALQNLYTYAVTSGCITGSGTLASPIMILLNPTGGLHCTPNGLAINEMLAATSGICTAWSYETGSAPGSPTQPTTPITNLSSGNIQVEVYDDMMRFWFYNGSSFVLDKEFSGGGGGTPSSPSTSIQFNNGGSFGGSSNLTWDGSVLSVTGTLLAGGYKVSPAAIINDAGTSRTLSATENGKTVVFSSSSDVTVTVPTGLGIGYSTSCIKTGTGNLTYTASSTTLQAPGGLTAYGQYNVSSIFAIANDTFNVLVGSTGAIVGGGTPGGSTTQIQFNNAGAFAGSALLNWNGSALGVSGTVNVSGAILAADAANILAQRNGATAQASRIYNTFTDSSNYERGVIDWAGSPGVLQIGTQQAGTGTARGVQLITSGTPRIDVSAVGNIQFNSAYTFPTGVGASGQTLVNNGVGVLSWAYVSGAGGGLTDGDKGDITVGGGGTTLTIDNSAVTYAKIQNVSATDRLLGRSGAGAGVVQEIVCTSFARSLLDDADAATARATLGFTEDTLGAFGDAWLATETIADAWTALGSANLNTVPATGLIGRGTAAGAGAAQYITLGTGLTMSGTVLSASGGSATVANGTYNQITVVGASDWRVTDTANLMVASIHATGFMGWFQKTRLSSATDGVLLLTNSGGTDFTRMQFGGTTAAFPSLRRSGVEAHFETADGSANIPIKVSGVMSSVYRTNAGNFIINNGTSHTIDASNNGKTFISYSASAVTLTVASGLDVGFSLSILQQGAGAITVSGAAGVTLNSYNNLYTTAGQYAAASLLLISGNTWNLAGSLA